MADGGRRRRAARAAAALAGALGLALAVGACGGGDPPGAAADTLAPTTATIPVPPSTATAPAGAATTTTGPGTRLRVTQHVTGCCYPHGSLSWLVVRDADGAEVVERRFRALSDVAPAIDTALPPGLYHVVSAQQACATASCARAGDPVDRCDADIELADAPVFLTVGLAPGGGCAVVLAPGPLPSTVGDAIALPGAALDCGYDPSLADASAGGDPVRVSAARRCLMAAVQRGDAAWLLAAEPELVVYRSDPTGAVEVDRVVDEQASAWAWTRSTCTTMVPDRVRAFLLQDCTPAEPVPWG